MALALKQMTDRGWHAEVCYIHPDGKAGQQVERHLASAKYDCIVIGAGVRLPPQRLADFEAIVNAVHKAAPAASIALIRGRKIAPMLPRDGYVHAERNTVEAEEDWRAAKMRAACE